NEQRRNCAEVKWSSVKCWISRLKMLPYLEPLVNVFLPTALRSIASALVLKSGGKHPEGFFAPVGTFILKTAKWRCAAIPIVFAPVATLTSWSCGCGERMGIIAGFW